MSIWISGGGGATVPSLPDGTINQILYHNGTEWMATTPFYKDADIVSNIDYTLNADTNTLLVTAETQDVTITLPNITAAVLNRTYIIKKIDNGEPDVIITGGAFLIDGQSSFRLIAQYNLVELLATTLGWQVLRSQ